MKFLGRYRLIVPAAVAKPSPSIGQALGPLGINMSDFCKKFNERTQLIRPNIPIQVKICTLSNSTYKFSLRTPGSQWFLRRIARVPMGASKPKHEIVGNVTLKEVYHIAKCKCMDPPLIGIPLYVICKRIIGTANAMGIAVTRELLPEFRKRDYTKVSHLDQMKKDIRMQRKSQKLAEHDTVILMIHNKGGFTAKIERGKTIKICKDTLQLDMLIGCSYGDVFIKERTEWIKIRRDDSQYSQYRSRIKENYTDDNDNTTLDNRDIYDDNTAQKLTYGDIQKLKKDKNAQEVIETIVDHSETFAKKSKMAQEKYIMRKEKRHIKLFYVRPCDVYNACECYFNSFPHKIGYLNSANLGMMLYLADIRYGYKVMVFDHSLGLITGAVSQRLSGSGKIYRLVAKGVSDKIVHELGIRYLDNIISIDLNRYISEGGESSLSLQNDATATRNSPGNDENAPDDLQPEIYNESSHCSDSENQQSCLSETDHESLVGKRINNEGYEGNHTADEKEPKRQKCSNMPGVYPLYTPSRDDIKGCQVIIGNISFNKCDKVNSVVSEYTRRMKLAADLYLDWGGRLVLFGQQYQPMAELQAMLTLSDEYVNVKFDEVFMREYQMLHMRTHPIMAADFRPCCGFVISATKCSKNIIN
ncbi:putative 54S ribosomal protein [Babesia sp. Xinjiang]|uniref:putative 54S ribosomal protein n=1 Tax=Babesia sp. Xinjiang TaxID=462227 RepID=UPI000A2345C6|nr:putative 54S ribosomal protein [Babesia sp. Xinjiang]ORM39426.1 putative 54S ribosomal protein [Babesia sp. Xinjiang]